ncbi:MAG TPA: CPBP family intramembrane glutamic endopeptidase, partial [Chitinophagaceae bacterium]|nr:CPBP family intramembrane glutamic endopeptidase [Chitinophagaceae bacterium]
MKYERLAHGTVGTVAALLTTYLFIRFDRKSFSDFGLKFEKSTLKKFFVGILIGIVLMGLSAICVIYFSGFKIEVNENSSILNFLFLTLPLIPLSFMEEVGFRGYPLTILKDKTGIRISILITSILFALYHLANGWTIANSFLGAGVWGIVYGISAIYSNGISMPTGLHYAANLTTSAFGITSNSF